MLMLLRQTSVANPVDPSRNIIDGQEAVIRVADHGPGLAAGEEQQIFDKFVRGAAATPGRRGAGGWTAQRRRRRAIAHRRAPTHASPAIAASASARAQAAAPRAFGRLPRTPCVVRPVEAYREREQSAAFSYPPSADGTRPGVYYINTYRAEARPVHRLAATTYIRWWDNFHIPRFGRSTAHLKCLAIIAGRGVSAR
jgi:hypothetical protein